MPTLEYDCVVNASWRAKELPDREECDVAFNDKNPYGQTVHWNGRHDNLFGSTRDWNAKRHKKPDLVAQSSAELNEADELWEMVSYHVDLWKKETAPLSSVARMIAHPSYLRLIALGGRSAAVLRLLLRELSAEPDFWFSALEAIAGENPVPEGSDFDASVESWVKWGKSRRFLS